MKTRVASLKQPWPALRLWFALCGLTLEPMCSRLLALFALGPQGKVKATMIKLVSTAGTG